MKTRLLMMLLAGMIFATAAISPAAPSSDDVSKALIELSKADWGSMPPSIATLDAAVNAAPADPAMQKLLQTQFLAMLSSDAKDGAKQYALRKLSLIGTSEAVAGLAPLLADKTHSHMARSALQRIGGPAAVKAIRDAVSAASGAQKAGMINSLGIMGDTKSVPALAALLKDADPVVVSAAATALGRLATPQAATALRAFRRTATKALAVVAANACLDVAEKLLKDGKADEAEAIYTSLENDKRKAVRIAAARGLVAANPGQAMPRLLKALDSKDAGLRGNAADMIRQAPGTTVTLAAAAGLANLGPEGQVALLGALASRKDAAARLQVVRLVASANAPVRLAAIEALASLGCAADVKLLAAIAAKTDDPAAATAKATLAAIPGKDIDQAVANAIASSTPAVEATLINVLTARQATQAVPAAVKGSTSNDVTVRIASYNAMAVLGGTEFTAAMARIVATKKDRDERSAAIAALCSICTRGREESATAVIAAMASGDAEAKKAFLRALLHAGGEKSLAAVKAVATGPDEDLAKEAVRTLAQWRQWTAAPVLIDLAKSSSNKTIKILAVRGVISLAGPLSDKNRAVSLLKDAQTVITRPDETKQLLGALGNLRHDKAMPLIVPYLDDEAVNTEASLAVIKLVKGTRSKSKASKAALAKVVATCKDKRIVKQAQDCIKDPRR